MDQSPKIILLKILDIIGYLEDKEALCQKFFNVIAQQTLGTLVSSLPPDKKKTVEDQLIEEKDATKVSQFFHDTFTEAQINEALKAVTQKAFSDYTKVILPFLTETQKQQIYQLTSGPIKTEEKNPEA